MPRSLLLAHAGGPLIPTETPAIRPGPGEVLIRHTAIGLNYVDSYFRSGHYPVPAYPAILGAEAAGEVVELGDGVADLRPGQRVAYVMPPLGAYTSARIVPANRLLPLPDGITSDAAAAMLLKGLTAHMLLNRVLPPLAGETILIHAAGGGLGQILVQWTKLVGATVIGTAGTPDKEAAARAAGADHVIAYRTEDFVARTRALTGDDGVAAAIDGIGGDILARTLACVRPFGMVASLGQPAGPIPPIDVETLGPKRALALARPSVFAYVADIARYRRAATETLAMMDKGVHAAITGHYPLDAAAEALDALSAGRTLGSLLLHP
jgi:NADPH2:quinone reductase